MKLPGIKINWRYAIGEFFIVVFGIIAAFQLDSWKEGRDRQMLLREYLTDIEVGLQTDSLFYSMSRQYFDSIQSDIKRTRAYLQEDKTTLPPRAQESIRDMTDWYRTYISNSAFEDLNSSGRMNLITDKGLRYNLIAYYQYIDFVKSIDEENIQSLNRMQEALLHTLDFQNDSIMSLTRDQKRLVLNFIDQKSTQINSYLGHRSTCQQINDQVRAAISETLKGKS